MHNTPGPQFYGRVERGRFVFVLKKCTQTLPQQCRILKMFRGDTPDPGFGVGEGRGRRGLFSFSENALTLSYSNAELKIFPVVIPPDPRFRGGIEEAKLHLPVILSGYGPGGAPTNCFAPGPPPT